VKVMSKIDIVEVEGLLDRREKEWSGGSLLQYEYVQGTKLEK
jgi:hypothetical protein